MYIGWNRFSFRVNQATQMVWQILNWMSIKGVKSSKNQIYIFQLNLMIVYTLHFIWIYIIEVELLIFYIGEKFYLLSEYLKSNYHFIKIKSVFGLFVIFQRNSFYYRSRLTKWFYWRTGYIMWYHAVNYSSTLVLCMLFMHTICK